MGAAGEPGEGDGGNRKSGCREEDGAADFHDSVPVVGVAMRGVLRARGGMHFERYVYRRFRQATVLAAGGFATQAGKARLSASCASAGIAHIQRSTPRWRPVK